MIAADTSAWVDYAKGAPSDASRNLERSLQDGTLVMPFPVLFEILSGPGLTQEAREWILRLPHLEIAPKYWERAGLLHRTLLLQGLKARAMDCLIAQACLDHDVGLIAGDQDLRHFVPHGLKLF